MNNLIINVLSDVNQFHDMQLPLEVDIYKNQSEITIEAHLMSNPHLNVAWETKGVPYRLQVEVLTPAKQKVWLYCGGQSPILVTQSAWEVDDYTDDEAKQLIGCYESSLSLIHKYTQKRDTIKLLNHIISE